MIKKITSKDQFMGKLSYESDILEEFAKICKENNIHFGRVEAIGVVKKANLGFYNQKNREYEFITIDKPLEITNLIGNISIKDGSPMVHAHITLSDEKGYAHGGHLDAGTIVFACEFIIKSFNEKPFERGFDQETGLPLWHNTV